jgi:hypothetical protein
VAISSTPTGLPTDLTRATAACSNALNAAVVAVPDRGVEVLVERGQLGRGVIIDAELPLAENAHDHA